MSLIKCPACGKENDGARECTRCGCELHILEKISRLAERELMRGKESLVNGAVVDAMSYAGRSWYLKKSPEAARLAFLSALAAGDFEQASRWYARNP